MHPSDEQALHEVFVHIMQVSGDFLLAEVRFALLASEGGRISFIRSLINRRLRVVNLSTVF